ncbi:MAG: N-acetylgalactosamine-6-sulfatase [Verrucomicrobiia bacterium Tous-C2TDCM]|nr:MAG: N-acetylgalactosamine-6-sulfatase [Verrucomicrobiae bacterium Tous-C2TDCM]
MKPTLILLLLFPLFLHAAEPLPNLILMMGDDHGWEETGYNGHPHVKTPVLDEMAATGLRFDRFYSAHPSCSPTRASFLTGRHPNRMGTFAPGWSFRPEEITIAHVATTAGYRCGHFGKWHVGAVKKESPVSPLGMGFHECLSHDNFFELNPSLSRNGGSPEVFPGESSAILIDETIGFLEQAQRDGKPFLAVIWFGSPHEPYQGMPQDLALYDELPDKYPDKMVKLTSNETGGQTTRPLGDVLRERYAEITAMDRAIGTLRRHLAVSGLKDNTLLFYCGDNGTSPDGFRESPHRGMKGDFYEGGTRVPGLMEWPARFPKPITTPLRASTSDLLPTIAGLTGTPLPDRPLDGIDLMSLLLDGIPERPSPLCFWGYESRALAARNPESYLDTKLQEGTTPLVKVVDGIATRNFQNYRMPANVEADRGGSRSIIDGRYKLLVQDRSKGAAKGELFDLETDPGEETDLASQKPEVVEALSQKLRDWQDSVIRSLSGADYVN